MIRRSYQFSSMWKLSISSHQLIFTDTNFSTLNEFYILSLLSLRQGRISQISILKWNFLGGGEGGQWSSFVSLLWLILFFMGALSIEKWWLLICNKLVLGAIFAVSSAKPSLSFHHSTFFFPLSETHVLLKKKRNANQIHFIECNY